MLAYQQIGKGKALVFLHGFLENSAIWYPIVAQLNSRYQCILIDFPGHGHSKITEDVSDVEYLADQVIAVLDELGIEEATIIGHSMGGYVALALADVYVSRLNAFVLINSTSLADDIERKSLRYKACKTVERNLGALIKLSIPGLFTEEYKSHFPETIQLFKSISNETTVKGAQAALKGMAIRPDRTYVFYDFSKPMLVINGAYDDTVDAESFSLLLPHLDHLEIYTFPSGHMSYVENEEEVIELIDQLELLV